MAKYSYEFKKEVVQEYLDGKGGYRLIAKKFGIPSMTKVKLWVDNYLALGDEGLMRSRKNQSFTFEYKLHVVELYLTSEVSYRELALQEGIHNPTQIVKWVNDFRIAGPDALRPKKRGRRISLEASNKLFSKTESVEIVSVDTTAEHVKQLEDELLKLKIENAYLKELRRLRLEEKALLKKQRESSTASEDNSN